MIFQRWPTVLTFPESKSIHSTRAFALACHPLPEPRCGWADAHNYCVAPLKKVMQLLKY